MSSKTEAIKRICGSKPAYLYSSFADYVLKTEGKCQCCHGYGRIVDPNYVRDPIEGYKMADRITCFECNGTGEATNTKMRAEYNAIRLRGEEKIDNWLVRRSKVSAALAKLDNDDIKNLRL